MRLPPGFEHLKKIILQQAAKRFQNGEQLTDQDHFYSFFIYLQESNNYLEDLSKINTHPHFDFTIDISFCRIWEELVNTGFSPLCGEILKLYKDDVISQFLNELLVFSHGNALECIVDRQNYKSNLLLSSVVNDFDILIAQSRKIIQLYYNWIVLGRNENIRLVLSNKKINKLENLFRYGWPLFYFSFLVTDFYHIDLNMIKQISLNDPELRLTSFSGHELSFQRKAFKSCVKSSNSRYAL